MNIITIGINLAKNIFAVHGVKDITEITNCFFK